MATNFGNLKTNKLGLGVSIGLVIGAAIGVIIGAATDELPVQAGTADRNTVSAITCPVTVHWLRH